MSLIRQISTKGSRVLQESQNAPFPQLKMLLWPNRLEIFNHAFRCIKAGSNNVFDRKEFKRGATVLKINAFAPMTQCTVFCTNGLKESFLCLAVKHVVK